MRTIGKVFLLAVGIAVLVPLILLLGSFMWGLVRLIAGVFKRSEPAVPTAPRQEPMP